jgi:hypothetical protein
MFGRATPPRHRRASRRASIRPALLLALAAAVIAALGVPLANSSLRAQLSNSTNSTATAGYFTCTTAAVGNATTNAYLAYPLNETKGTKVADVSGNGRGGTYSSSGITYGGAGPCPRDGAKAVTLNGSTGYISGAATVTNPQIFSEEIWFKTTTGGGKLIGFGTSSSGASTQYDRHIFLNDGGNLVFGVYPGEVVTIASPKTYLDGKWHDAVATLAPSTNASPGMRLYVDGAVVASDASTTSAESDTGYWRIGYDNLSAWGSEQPTNFFFTGSLAFASVYTYAMTAAQVAAHYRAGI